MPDVRAASDAGEADWVVRGLRDFDYTLGSFTVGALVPADFEQYARVFHPAMLREAAVRWSQVANANGRVMHPAAEWGSLTGSWRLRDQTDLWDQEPRIGELPERLAKRLADVLAPHTRNAGRCLFGVWEGWGVPSVMMLFPEGTSKEDARRAEQAAEARIAAWHGFLKSAPRLELPAQREMRLLEGSLDAVSEFYTEQHRRPPGLWWPADRTWCVGTDIDLMTTYVGGSDEAVSALLADEQLEALPVPVDQRVDWEADTINPLPRPPS